ALAAVVKPTMCPSVQPLFVDAADPARAAESFDVATAPAALVVSVLVSRAVHAISMPPAASARRQWRPRVEGIRSSEKESRWSAANAAAVPPTRRKKRTEEDWDAPFPALRAATSTVGWPSPVPYSR